MRKRVMGEIINDFTLEFNGSVRLEARAERLTSEAGAVLLREVEERLAKLEERGTHEWAHQAQSWSRARRVVRVVQQREDQAFWLVTSWTQEEMPAEELLEHYRQRGTAEGHSGELMDVLAPALSSAPRPGSNYQGSPPVKRSTSINAFANDEVRLLLNALAYDLVHAARVLLLEQATGEGWGLRRVRERVLKVAARASHVLGQPS
jgi:hypothetical protein